ncbi:MAG: M20 family metallopeptidase [Clostridia bacterium]
MKKIIESYVDEIKNELIDLANYIYNNPEVGLKEYKASTQITILLQNLGFKVQKGIAGLETAFRAEYSNKKGGPVIGLLCEYDALEGLGHACGHHIQPSVIIGAAYAIKNSLVAEPYTLVIFGTPAEETIGGKLQMLEEGCFTELDVALMVHGGPKTTTDIKSLALNKIEVVFKGKSAHAALRPDQGRSALDAMLLSFQGIEFLREHVTDDVKLHYTVINGGGPANIIPSNAIGSYYIRAEKNANLEETLERFKNIIKGAALMTDTDYDLIVEKSIKAKVPVLTLNNLLMKNAKALGAKRISKPREKTGSTDFGNVMSRIPGSCLRIALVPEGTSSHSLEFLNAGKTEDAKETIIMASKILALSINDLVTKKYVLKDIKKEFEDNKRIN